MKENEEDQFHKELFSILAGKSNEIDWFSFENKIRGIISDQV
jgi:hypothetical protein